MLSDSEFLLYPVYFSNGDFSTFWLGVIKPNCGVYLQDTIIRMAYMRLKMHIYREKKHLLNE